MIQVLILDDNLVHREGIAKVVEDTKTMTVVGKAATPEEALAILEKQVVELALVDLELANHLSGIQVGRAMRRVRPVLMVIIYTQHKGMVLASEILWEHKQRRQPKLQGYVLSKNIYSSDHLRAIYDKILAIGHFIDPEVLEWHWRLGVFEPLTAREEECALLVAEGHSNQEISERMVLSRKRVENLVGALYLKFQIPGDPRNPGRRVLLAESIKRLYGLRWPKRKLTVLLVDDKPEELRRLRALLRHDERFEVVGEAESGRHGLEIAKAEWPDLALVDIVMDELDGFQTARRIISSQPDTHVILTSESESRTWVDEAKRVGAVAFLPKFKLTADAIYALAVEGIRQTSSAEWG